MPTKPPVKKSSSTTTEILEELRTLNENVEELHAYIVRAQKRKRQSRVWDGIVGGLLHATGLVIGTIVITAALVYVGQILVRSDWFREWIAASFQEVVENVVQNALTP